MKIILALWSWCLLDVNKEELLTLKLEMDDKELDKKTEDDRTLMSGQQTTDFDHEVAVSGSAAGGGDFVSSDIVALRSNEATNIDDVNLQTDRLKQDPDVADETLSLKQSRNVTDDVVNNVVNETESLKPSWNVVFVVADETKSLKHRNVADDVGNNVADETKPLKQKSQNIADVVSDNVVDETKPLKQSQNVVDSVGDNVADETEPLKKSRNIADDVANEVLNETESLKPSRNVADDVAGPSETKKSLCQRLCDVLSPLVSGWRAYARQSVVFAGLSLAMLYMTVLGFDSITVG